MTVMMALMIWNSNSDNGHHDKRDCNGSSSGIIADRLLQYTNANEQSYIKPRKIVTDARCHGRWVGNHRESYNTKKLSKRPNPSVLNGPDTQWTEMYERRNSIGFC